MVWRVGIDSGGTFCDLVAYNPDSGELRVAKYSSNPENPVSSILEVIKQARIPFEEIDIIVHGTTVLTNYLIEEKGPAVAYITNKGFKDVIFIQNANRQFLYDLQWKKSAPLVRRANCFEVDCRIDSHGCVFKDIEKEEVLMIISKAKEKQIKNFAVCFLFSFLNPIHEIEVKKIFNEYYPDAVVSLSHDVYKRWKEYDRASTTIADAYLRRYFVHYITQLISTLKGEKMNSPIFIMKSNGGMMSTEVAGEKPAHVIMSGPVAGVLGAKSLCNSSAIDSAITMDIGGTSCDVYLYVKDDLSMKSEYEIKWGIPVKIPMMAIHSIGAGGGSIARVDSGNLLQVGPQSAGGRPGPVCYMRGGHEPTLTDANLILGRINPDYFCQGKIILNKEAAFDAIKKLSIEVGIDPYITAESIVKIVDNNSANAIRVISIERGINPREFLLVGFGGAGGLHVREVASLLGTKRAMVPLYPGNVSALGLLTGDFRVDHWSTLIMRSDNIDLNKANKVLSELRGQCLRDIRREGPTKECSIIQKIEMRYFGQNYHREILLKIQGKITEEDMNEAFNDFHNTHIERYGYANLDDLIEIVGMLVTTVSHREKLALPRVSRGDSHIKEIRKVFFDSEIKWVPCKVYERDFLEVEKKIEGPAIIEEPFSTIVVWPGDSFYKDSLGSIFINIGSKK